VIYRAALAVTGLLWCGPVLAQPSPQRNRVPSTLSAEPCDLLGQPGACTACPGLMAALRLPGAPTGDNGPGPDGIAWSPLYVAFRLNCPEAGRLLLARGANPERGGKAGALLAEVAAQHFTAIDQRSAAVQSFALEWVSLLSKPRPFDLDAPIGDGMPSTRVSWSIAQAAGPLQSGASVVWSRIEALSANFPVLVNGGERVNVDYPAPDTGLTRPSETAVSRGVEAMLATLDHTGMVGVTNRVQACWAEVRPAGMLQAKWRWHVDNCAAMDVAAAGLDAVVAPKLGGARQDYFLDEQLLPRLAVFNGFQRDGLQPAQYLRALRRSVDAWMPIQYAIRSKG
jgi:hypothetical protein